MKFVQMNSPKNAGTAAHIAARSMMRPLYESQDACLFKLTPEVQQILVLPSKAQQYEGTFALGAFRSYAAVFADSAGAARISKRKPLRVICTYVIKNTVNGSVYIGSTKDFFCRWGGHARGLRRGMHTNIQLQDEFNKHGEAAFTISIIKSYSTTDGLLEHEERAASQYPTDAILNFRVGMKHHNGWCIQMNCGMGRATRPTRNKRGPQTRARWFDKQGV